jgi:hypothetical protein
MNHTVTTKRRPRSVAAVFAGLLTNIIPAVAIDAALHAADMYPPMGQPMSNALLVLAFSYRLVLAVAGGYFTARLAPDNPVKHALVLGAIGVVLSSAGAIAMWDVGPAWYPLSLVAIAVPCSLLGARLHRRS